jgi:hypothetical protein
VVFIGYNLVFGLLHPHIDMAAHVGGLVSGFVFGLVLSQPLTPESVHTRWARNLALAWVGSILVAAGVLATPRHIPAPPRHVRDVPGPDGGGRRGGQA